jgi:hypothetical protein
LCYIPPFESRIPGLSPDQYPAERNDQATAMIGPAATLTRIIVHCGIRGQPVALAPIGILTYFSFYGCFVVTYHAPHILVRAPGSPDDPPPQPDASSPGEGHPAGPGLVTCLRTRHTGETWTMGYKRSGSGRCESNRIPFFMDISYDVSTIVFYNSSFYTNRTKGSIDLSQVTR